MCGIAGILGRADREAVARMLDPQQHRGPDGRQIWTAPGGEVTLGHDRLAIVDLEGGAQPICNEDGTLWAVVNGEIYNHRWLRQSLSSRHQFRTDSDSEIVLHLYEEEGPSFVRRLDGMFSLAIWGADGRLFLARDPLGIKPLYYGHDVHGHLCFASEIKALVETVDEVRALPPGTGWFYGGPQQRFYVVPWPSPMHLEPVGAVNLIDTTLNRAVRKRLMADVPLGVFLSGGLDSSLIAAIVRRHVPGELHSFAVGLEGSADLVNARRVAGVIGTIHHERVLSPEEVTGAIPEVIDKLESCDPALVRSAIPTYFVSQLAAELVKVVLSGEGADELFAGYHYLAEFEDDMPLELRQITCGLHNTNLQRVDRMTMAHGLEGRVPFLDAAMVEMAFKVDPGLKRRNGEGKWILRKVAERYLPHDIVWRPKEKFAIGTGIGPLLQQHAEDSVKEMEPGFHAAEEYLYWTHFRRRYGRDDIIQGMGRSRSLNPGERWVSALR